MMLASKVGVCSDPELADFIQTGDVGGGEEERIPGTLKSRNSLVE